MMAPPALCDPYICLHNPTINVTCKIQVLNGYRGLQNVFVGKAERLGLKPVVPGTHAVCFGGLVAASIGACVGVLGGLCVGRKRKKKVGEEDRR